MIAQILGEVQLPWEQDGELLKRAGRFRSAVLGLLQRDPSQRSTVQTFMQEYASITSSSTTQPDTSGVESAKPADVAVPMLFKQGSAGSTMHKQGSAGVQNTW